VLLLLLIPSVVTAFVVAVFLRYVVLRSIVVVVAALFVVYTVCYVTLPLLLYLYAYVYVCCWLLYLVVGDCLRCVPLPCCGVVDSLLYLLAEFVVTLLLPLLIVAVVPRLR